MALRFISVLAALLLLAACETSPEGAGGAGGAGGAVGSSSGLPSPRMGSAEDFVVNVGDRVFYDFDKYTLKPQARETLQRQSAWLKKFPAVTISIQGHCDERGTREYNLALGERRANSAKNYLVALGVNPNRVKVLSYGKERPAVTGSNEAAWSQNRRSVTVVNAAGS